MPSLNLAALLRTDDIRFFFHFLLNKLNLLLDFLKLLQLNFLFVFELFLEEIHDAVVWSWVLWICGCWGLFLHNVVWHRDNLCLSFLLFLLDIINLLLNPI